MFFETIGTVLTPFLWAIFISTLGENVLLNRGLDASQMIKIVDKRPRDFVQQSFLLTLVMITSTCLVYPVYGFVRSWEARYPFIPLIYTVCVMIVYFVIRWSALHFFPRHTLGFDQIFTTATFSCAVLGSLLVIVQRNSSFFEAIGYALGTGIGYLLACVFLWEGERRLRLCDLPKPFKGLPIELIYIGILSLAIYGITGFQSYS